MHQGSIIAIFFIGTIVLGVINMYVFLFSWKGLQSKPVKCSVDRLLLATGNILDSNGINTLTEMLPDVCRGRCFDNEAESMNKLRKSFQKLLHDCNARKVLSEYPDLSATGSILTFFTTWADDGNLRDIRMKTIANWSKFLPKFNLVVFTNESFVASLAIEYGWTVFPVLHHAAGGAPVLKTMFTTVMSRFDSMFYGYANSDILFTDDLYDSLEIIALKFKPTEPVFITGIRTDVPYLSSKETSSFINIINAAAKRGRLSEAYSADYFFTTKSFPWVNVPSVVIGRQAIDNFVIEHARNINATVIDTTATVHAVHQTPSAGKTEEYKHDKYNDKYLKDLGFKPRYRRGHVACAEWKSYETLCGDKDVVRRKSLSRYC